VVKALHKCMTKATTAEDDAIRRSFNWAVSHRGILEVRPDALVCGEWVIPYCEIDEAVLYNVRQMFIPGYVLLVRSRGMTYQFGLNWGRFWTRDLPFDVRRERARLGYSWFSIAFRGALLGLVAYWLWRRSR
jgi:hypothetical protein